MRSRKGVRLAAVPIVLAMVFAGAPGFGAPRPAAAASRSVQAWVEVGSTAPAVGCLVDVSVEVREAGNVVPGTEALVALAIGGDVYALDRSVTDEAGVAFLALDTSAAATGDAWLDVVLGGVYVGGMRVALTDDGACGGASAMVTVTGTVPVIEAAVSAEIDDASGESGSATGAGTFLSVPTYRQERNLSCEFAALSIATGALGGWVSEYAFDDVVGESANPHWGFRGDILGYWGNTDDYGVYAEALAPALAAYGYSGEVFYGGGNSSALTARLDRGLPTLVWLGFWGDTSYVDYTDDGTAFALAAGEHVVVAYGYDAGGVYVSDPAIGDYRYFTWDHFLSMWNVLDGMSLAVGAA